jgi:hypothetical protein
MRVAWPVLLDKPVLTRKAFALRPTGYLNGMVEHVVIYVRNERLQASRLTVVARAIAEWPTSYSVFLAAFRAYLVHLFFTGPIGPSGCVFFGCCRAISDAIRMVSVAISLRIASSSSLFNNHLKNLFIMLPLFNMK